MISFDNVVFAYGTTPDSEDPKPSHSHVALDDVSLTVEPGERVVVLGPNGSGKSTLARLTNGLLTPRDGVITVDGIDTTDETRVRELRTLVGLIPQDPDNAIVATNVVDEVAFGPENLGLPREEIISRVDDALTRVGLEHERDRDPHTLSGGQKQRLVIAGILAMSPRYLIFDEPTSMLDPLGVFEVRSVIKTLQETGHGILHITHDLTDLSGATRVIVIMAGRIAFTGTPAELFAQSDILEEARLETPPLLQLAQMLEETPSIILPKNPLDGDALADAVAQAMAQGASQTTGQDDKTNPTGEA